MIKSGVLDALAPLFDRLTHCSSRSVGELLDLEQLPSGSTKVAKQSPDCKPIGMWLAMDNLWLVASMRYGKAFRTEHFGSTSMRSNAWKMYRARIPACKGVVWMAGMKKTNNDECDAGAYRDKLLLLLDADAVAAFHRRYRSVYLPNQAAREVIDWVVVARHFAGVFVMASDRVLRACKQHTWLQLWELPSACVWRPKALQLSLQALPERDVRARVARCAAILAT